MMQRQHNAVAWIASRRHPEPPPTIYGLSTNSDSIAEVHACTQIEKVVPHGRLHRVMVSASPVRFHAGRRKFAVF